MRLTLLPATRLSRRAIFLQWLNAFPGFKTNFCSSKFGFAEEDGLSSVRERVSPRRPHLQTVIHYEISQGNVSQRAVENGIAQSVTLPCEMLR